MKLLLFDIDGTLVLTGGAGKRGLNRAFHSVFGVPDAFESVHLAGCTDPGILAEALARAGVEPADGDEDRFRAAYLDALADEITRPAPAGAVDWSSPWRFKGVLPGVREVLDALGPREDACVALLTGNYTQGARIKLGHFGLWDRFCCGAFGEDAPARWELVEVARRRAEAFGCGPIDASDVWVIGDTPLDVAAARQAGVRSLAVATGGFDVERLAASGADVAVPRLSVETLPF